MDKVVKGSRDSGLPTTNRKDSLYSGYPLQRSRNLPLGREYVYGEVEVQEMIVPGLENS